MCLLTGKYHVNDKTDALNPHSQKTYRAIGPVKSEVAADSTQAITDMVTKAGQLQVALDPAPSAQPKR